MTPRLGLLSVIVLVCIWFSFFAPLPNESVQTSKSTQKTVSASASTIQSGTIVSAPTSKIAPNSTAPQEKTSAPIQLVPRHQLISQSPVQAPSLFAASNWLTSQPASVPIPQPVNPQVVKPSVPLLDIQVIGKSLADGRWSVFLVRQGLTWVVQEGEVIDNVYKVRTIAPPRLELIYLPLNEVQTLDIGSSD